MQKVWQIWKYSLGSFSDDKTKPYDNYVAIIRSIIFVSLLTTNMVIVSGVIRHWNDVPSELSKTEEKRICKTFCNLPKN
jgi:hypothetical protein